MIPRSMMIQPFRVPCASPHKALCENVFYGVQLFSYYNLFNNWITLVTFSVLRFSWKEAISLKVDSQGFCSLQKINERVLGLQH